MKILNWNFRSLGGASKRRIRKLLYSHSVDIVGLQGIKKESFSTRILQSVSSTITWWLWLPAVVLAGGILIGVNETKFEILNSQLGLYSITVFLKNKSDGVSWTFTNVYGPTVNSPREPFWDELRSLRASFGGPRW